MTAAKKTKTKTDAKDSSCPIYVVSGKDRRRAIDQLHQLTDELVGDADPQMALTQYDGKDAKLADVLTDLQTMPFLSDKRIVVVKDADDFITEYRQALEKYLDKPSPTGILVLYAETFPRTTRLCKIAEKVGQVIEFKPVGAKQLPEYLIDYASNTYSLAMNERAAKMLIDLGGDEAGILCSEIDKMAAYLADPKEKGGAITPELVQKLTGNNRQFNVFTVIDAMTSGQTKLALERLDTMMRQDREAEYSAVGAFAWHVRRMYKARILMDKKVNEETIIKEVNIWNQRVEFIKQVKALGIKTIASMLKKLADIDLAQKTGGGEVKDGLEKLIVQFSRMAIRK